MEGSVRQVHAQRLRAHAAPPHHSSRVQKLVHPHALVLPYRAIKEGDPYVGGVVYRTAPIKHHLRVKVRTPDKISTYEHDYSSIAMRPKLEAVYPAVTKIKQYIPGSDVTGISSSRSTSSRSAGMSTRATLSRSSSSGHMSRPKARRYTAIETVEKLPCLQRSLSGPVALAINDWSGSWWSPKAYPHMCEGGTDKQLHLRQMVHRLNLRSPDLLNHVN